MRPRREVEVFSKLLKLLGVVLIKTSTFKMAYDLDTNIDQNQK